MSSTPSIRPQALQEPFSENGTSPSSVYVYLEFKLSSGSLVGKQSKDALLQSGSFKRLCRLNMYTHDLKLICRYYNQQLVAWCEIKSIFCFCSRSFHEYSSIIFRLNSVPLLHREKVGPALGDKALNPVVYYKTCPTGM